MRHASGFSAVNMSVFMYFSIYLRPFLLRSVLPCPVPSWPIMSYNFLSSAVLFCSILVFRCRGSWRDCDWSPFNGTSGVGALFKFTPRHTKTTVRELIQQAAAYY